jgi:hypothetical protein
MLKTNFAPLYDISMMGHSEKFSDVPSFPSSPFSGRSGIKMDFKKPSDDPNFKNSTTVTSSVSKTPGSEIDNLKMKQDANINNTSSSKVTDTDKRDVSTKITSTDTSKQDKISNSSTSVTREQSEPTTSDNSVPVKIDTSDLNKVGVDIIKTTSQASQSMISYIYYLIAFILLIGIGITVFMLMGKKSKVKINKLSLDSTSSDNTLVRK